MRAVPRILVTLVVAATGCVGDVLGESPPSGPSDCDVPAATGKFTDRGDGTVGYTAPVIRTVFQKDSPGSDYTWNGANEYCEDLELAGLDWRLPERSELEGLLVDCPVEGCRMEATFEGSCNYYWASDEEKPGDPDSPRGFTDMGFGGSGFDGKGYEHAVRCVAKQP